MWLRFFRDKTAAVQTICLLRVVRTWRLRHEMFILSEAIVLSSQMHDDHKSDKTNRCRQVRTDP